VDLMIVRTSSLLKLGFRESNSPARPETSGAANDVPLAWE
jgi:hypothetical protein